MRIMGMKIEKPIMELQAASPKRFIYKKISFDEKEDIYLYQIKYKSSGLVMDVIMNSSEVLWLKSSVNSEFMKKFTKALDVAFVSFMRTTDLSYKKAKEDK